MQPKAANEEFGMWNEELKKSLSVRMSIVSLTMKLKEDLRQQIIRNSAFRTPHFAFNS